MLSFAKQLTSIVKNIKNYFIFIFESIFSSIRNFYKFLSNTIINGLNNVYNFKVKENIFNKFISRAGFISLIIILGFGVFYVKELVSNLDLVKFSFEIKSDNAKNKKNKEGCDETALLHQ